MLRQLLSRLENQETEDLFDYSIVVVDNDKSESARLMAEAFATQSMISIRYYVEPEQNIALARNKAIENVQGEFIGFIDDDEFPVPESVFEEKTVGVGGITAHVPRVGLGRVARPVDDEIGAVLHLPEGAARVAGDEVREDVLLFSGGAGRFCIPLPEPVEYLPAGLVHQSGHPGGDVFRGDLEVA